MHQFPMLANTLQILTLITTAATFAAVAEVSSTRASVENAIERLASEEYPERRAAIDELVRLSDTDWRGTSETMVRLSRDPDPERQANSMLVLEKIFERRELGVGLPHTGIGWAWFADYKDRRLSAFPIVETVKPESPGSKAGLKPGDVILAWNGTPTGADQPLGMIRRLIAATPAKSQVKVRVRRMRPGDKGLVWTKDGGKRFDLKLTLGEIEKKGKRKADEGEFEAWLASVRATVDVSER